MSQFTLHTKESAPESTKETFDAVQQKFGTVPNLLRAMSNSPAALHGYLNLMDTFSKSSLKPAEQAVVSLTASSQNCCHYGTAAHSTLASQSGLDAQEIERLKNNQELSDPKLQAIRAFTQEVVTKAGHLKPEVVDKFLAAGFTHESVLDVVTGVAAKTLSNYTNHIVDTPVDEIFKAHLWQKEEGSDSSCTTQSCCS